MFIVLYKESINIELTFFSQEELLDDVNINRILLQTKIRQLNAQIPVNRQMKADIVRVRRFA
jgi:hypothetical protein